MMLKIKRALATLFLLAALAAPTAYAAKQFSGHGTGPQQGDCDSIIICPP